MQMSDKFRPVSEWDTYAFCKKCDHHERAPFASIFHTHREVCPKCGVSTKDNWVIKTVRWVREKGWFKPAAIMQIRGEETLLTPTKD